MNTWEIIALIIALLAAVLWFTWPILLGLALEWLFMPRGPKQ